jgi:hypothetical protein
MLKIINVINDTHIEYCSFLDEENGTFNLVSTINNEECINLIDGYSSLIRLNSKGFLQEIEILSTRPSITDIFTINCRSIINGIPVFDHNEFRKSTLNPVILTNNNRVLIVFDKISGIECDFCIKGNKIKFYLIKDFVIAIEISEMHKDFGGYKQIQWLENRNVL